jgi:hypothetical protein
MYELMKGLNFKCHERRRNVSGKKMMLFGLRSILDTPVAVMLKSGMTCLLGCDILLFGRYVPMFRKSLSPSRSGSHWTNFNEIWYLSIFLKHVDKIQVPLKHDKNNGTLYEDLCTFMIVSRWILHKMRNLSDNCRENQNPHFMLNTFFSKNYAVCEIMWKNMAEPDRPQMTI